jgi:HicB family
MSATTQQRVEDAVPPNEEEAEASHSGRLLLRMPQSLHAELARTAEREGTSLNGFITGVLSSAVGWRSPERNTTAPPRSRLFRIAVAIDLVLVAIAAVVSIALLIVAWP